MYADLLFRLALLAFLIWVVWKLFQPRCAFVIRIAAGKTQAIRGVVTPAFLEEVREIAQRHGLEAGVIQGVVRGPRISLVFSRTIPQGARQQLRNWWALSGWLAQPIRVRRRRPPGL